jgi:sulfatase maturation enzyme AslB (radical SAM superfamily)|tara:strand:- start:15917 stop:17212 length:1296 start_codon:yes stop_codon:yes gene_type:complete
MNQEPIKFVDAAKAANLDKTLDGSSMCAMKWIHFYIHLKEGIVKNCHNVPHRHISQQELDEYGKDVFVNHPYEIERRKEKLANIKHTDCSACWRNEERGIRSPRLPKAYYDFHRKRFDEPIDELKAMPSQLELYFNNTCDLKCVYCNETFSSQWEIENRKFDIKPSEKNVAPEGFQDLFYEWLEQDAVPYILQYYILGGEPLIQNEVYEFIDRLIPMLKAKQNKFKIKPVLIVISNGNTPQAYLDKWLRKVKEIEPYVTVQMDISMESFGRRAEFIRTNLIWDRFAKNIERIIEFSADKDMRIRFSTTHNVLSITSCLDLVKWLHGLSKQYNVKLDLIRSNVSYPKHLSPWMLTNQYNTFIDNIVSWITEHAPEWKDYADFMQSIGDSFGKHTEADRIAAAVWIDTMKARRNLDLLEYFPEMRSWEEYVNG